MLFQPASNIQVPFMQPQFRRGRATAGGGGGFDPLTVLDYLWDFDTFGGANNDPVSAVVDSIAGLSISASGSLRPTYKTAALNGHACAEFSGSTQVLTYSNGGGAFIPQGSTYFVLVKIISGAGQKRFISRVGSGRQLMYGQLDTYRLYAGADIASGSLDTNWHLWTAEFNGGSSKLFIDGTLTVSGNAGSEVQDGGITVGAESAEGNYAQCSIAWLGIKKGILTQSNRESCDDFVGSRFGITITH